MEKISICEHSICTGCGACMQSCPSQCIFMKESPEGFLYPEIDEAKCIRCEKCVRICPNNNKINTHTSKFYMGWHKDLNVRKKSSSGGAFTAIAQWVFERGGVVYGAHYDEKSGEIYHVKIDCFEMLDSVRLSKYYQGRSDITYSSVKKDLLNNKLVLFSGTACQIAGLYTYLEKKYDNLITVDVLCHGIASKKVVDSYIKSKEKQYKKTVKNYIFRLKPNDSDWLSGGGTRMKLNFTDGTSVVEDKELDTFFTGFNNYLFLRESCYQCRYVGTERIADFTLADYWGVPLDQISEQERKYGVSLLVANSDRANNMIEELMEHMVIEEIDSKIAIQHNQAFREPSSANINRDDFFRQLDKKGFDTLVYKYMRKYYFKMKVRRILISILGERNFFRIKRIVINR